MLFWEKYVIAGKIKIGILQLTIRRGQSNLSIVLIFVSFEENGYVNVNTLFTLGF